MLNFEFRIRSDGRDLSLDDVANSFAEKVLNGIAPLLQQQPKRPEELNNVPNVVNIRRASELIGLSRSTVWKLIKEKRLEVVHLGRRTMVRMRSIDKILKQGLPI
jgi:excisionase family DNA binding protein